MLNILSKSVAVRALAAALAGASAPAFADHAGPSSVGSGGGMFVIAPETLAPGQFAAGLRLMLTRPDQRSDDELAALAGRHVHAHNSDYNLNASFGFAYGVRDWLTLSAELPYVRRDGLREGAHSHVEGVTVNGIERLGSVSGIGDLNLLAKARLHESEAFGVDLLAGIKAPTGSTRKRSRDGERLETEHQPGTGSWDPLLGAALAAGSGPVRLTASALWQIAGKGAQATRLGDRLQAGIALSHRFAPAEHHHEEGPHEEAGEKAPHGHSAWDGFVELTGEIEGRQKVAGEVEADSGGAALWLSPGARFTTAGGTSFGASVGIPVAQDIRASHPDNRFRLTVAVGRQF